MAASVRVILSARATWAVTNDANVEENVRTASMMVKKSRGGNSDILRRRRGCAGPSGICRGSIGDRGL